MWHTLHYRWPQACITMMSETFNKYFKYMVISLQSFIHIILTGCTDHMWCNTAWLSRSRAHKPRELRTLHMHMRNAQRFPFFAQEKGHLPVNRAHIDKMQSAHVLCTQRRRPWRRQQLPTGRIREWSTACAQEFSCVRLFSSFVCATACVFFVRVCVYMSAPKACCVLCLKKCR